MNTHRRLQSTRITVKSALTPERIRELVEIYLKRTLEACFENRLFRNPGNFLEEIDEEGELLDSLLYDVLENIHTGEIPKLVQQKADELLEEHGINNPKLNPAKNDNGAGVTAYRFLCDRLQRAQAAVLESETAGPCWDGHLRQNPALTTSMVESIMRDRQSSVGALNRAGGESQTTTPSPTVLQPEGPASPTINEAIGKFIGERSPKWGRSTAMDTPKRLHTFLSIIGGEDMTFADFSRDRDAIRRYHRVMTSIPAQYGKKSEWRELGWDALVALKVPPELRFKKETLKNNFNTVRGFLSWAEDEGYLARSKAFKKILVELPADVKGGDKRGFTREELVRLFSPEHFLTPSTGLDPERPWKFWVPVMALFTGARIEEICQLDLTDIRLERNAEETQGMDGEIWYVHITDTGSTDDNESGERHKSVKTKAGVRKVPLHPFLLGENGSPVNLLEYVARLKESGETRLFPMLSGSTARGNRSDAVTKWFTRYRRDCGVGAKPGEYSDVTFHSFRHTVISQAKVKDVERRKVKQMVGHEAGLNEAADITTRYEDAYPLGIIARDVVGVLDFDATLNLYTLLQRWSIAPHV